MAPVKPGPRRPLNLSLPAETPSYLRQLVTSLRLFRRFLSVHAPAASPPRGPRETDSALVLFIQHCYNTKVAYHVAACAVLAVQHKFSWSGRLQKSWKALKKWKLNMPSKSRAPLPISLLRAFVLHGFSRAVAAGGCLAAQWFSFSILIWLAFDGLLRPKEVAGLLRRDVLFPSESGFDGAAVVLTLHLPKTRRAFGRTQFVMVDNPSLCSWLRWWCFDLPQDSALFPGSQRSFAMLFGSVAQALDCPVYTPGCLRSGGAVHFFRECQNLGKTMMKGRWLSERTLQHYLTEAFGKAVEHRLSARAQSVMASADVLSKLLHAPPTKTRAGVLGDAAHLHLLKTALKLGSVTLAERQALGAAF